MTTASKNIICTSCAALSIPFRMHSVRKGKHRAITCPLSSWCRNAALASYPPGLHSYIMPSLRVDTPWRVGMMHQSSTGEWLAGTALAHHEMTNAAIRQHTAFNKSVNLQFSCLAFTQCMDIPSNMFEVRWVLGKVKHWLILILLLCSSTYSRMTDSRNERRKH